MKKCTLILIFFLISILVTSGCTRSEVPVSNESVTPVQTTILPSPDPTVYNSPVLTPVVTYRPGTEPSLSVSATVSPTRIASDNPYLEFLQIRKKTFDYSIPNCPMEEAFPAIVKDSDYGINQIVPKLTAVSDDEYETFLRKYTEGKAENTLIKTLSQCQGADGNPYWNFVETRVILNPTNFEPANYTISLNVRSKGEIIAQFKTTRTLSIDKKISITSYIPLKADELDLFDTVGVTYTRLPG